MVDLMSRDPSVSKSSLNGNSSLEAGVMRRPRNQANAFKHGVFAGMMILPWEDPREFEKLCSSLVDEWKPDVQLNTTLS
jgi:hypothetical protein